MDLYVHPRLLMSKDYALCQSLLRGKPKDVTSMTAISNIFREYLLYGAKFIQLCRSLYNYKHTFSATLTFKCTNLNQLTLTHQKE